MRRRRLLRSTAPRSSAADISLGPSPVTTSKASPSAAAASPTRTSVPIPTQLATDGSSRSRFPPARSPVSARHPSPPSSPTTPLIPTPSPSPSPPPPLLGGGPPH